MSEIVVLRRVLSELSEMLPKKELRKAGRR